MQVRNGPIVGVLAAVLGLLSLVAGLDAAIPAVNIPIGAHIGFGIGAIAGVALLVRVLSVGLVLEPNQMVVRDLFSTTTVQRRDVLGLAVGPVSRGWFRRALLVCADGRVVAAAWTITSRDNAGWQARMTDLARGFGETQERVTETLSGVGRLDRTVPPALLPLAIREPILSPATVSPVSSPEGRKLLGWETIFVVGAMVVPGVIAAVSELIDHFVTSKGESPFDLPIDGHPTASLVVLIISYLTTAVIVPIALLQLTRTGQPPSSFGLTLQGVRRDALGGVGLLGGAELVSIAATLSLTAIAGSNFLDQTQSSPHVPKYYLIYGLLIALTTAINEEVIVNGYFMTRLAQLGYAPRVAFAISLATRTSYHIYYGIGFVATIPFGYLVTRSFQKRGKLTRPIIAHFLFDAIAFTIAVLSPS